MLAKYEDKIQKEVNAIRTALQALEAEGKIEYRGEYNQMEGYDSEALSEFKQFERSFPLEGGGAYPAAIIFHEYYDFSSLPDLPGFPVDIAIWKQETRRKADLPKAHFIDHQLAARLNYYEEHFSSCLEQVRQNPSFSFVQEDVQLVQALIDFYQKKIKGDDPIQIFYKDFIFLPKEVTDRFIKALTYILEEKLHYIGVDTEHNQGTVSKEEFRKKYIKKALTTIPTSDKSKLSTTGVALLIHYLTRIDLIIDHSASHNARLFEELTGKSEQNIRSTLGKIARVKSNSVSRKPSKALLDLKKKIDLLGGAISADIEKIK